MARKIEILNLELDIIEAEAEWLQKVLVLAELTDDFDLYNETLTALDALDDGWYQRVAELEELLYA